MKVSGRHAGNVSKKVCSVSESELPSSSFSPISISPASKTVKAASPRKARDAEAMEDSEGQATAPFVPTDCQIIEPGYEETRRGILDLTDTSRFLPLHAWQIELGRLIAKATICPLRWDSWVLLKNLSQKPKADQSVLSRRNLKLLLYVVLPDTTTARAMFPDLEDELSEANKLAVATVHSQAWHTENEKGKAFCNTVYSALPGQYEDMVPPGSAQSPYNATWFLMAWKTLWETTCNLVSRHTSRPGIRGAGYVEDTLKQALASTARFDANSAENYMVSLTSGLDRCQILNEPIEPDRIDRVVNAAVTGMMMGKEHLSPTGRTALHGLLIRMYKHLPGAWLDLKKQFGDAAMAFGMRTTVEGLDRYHRPCIERARIVLRRALSPDFGNYRPGVQQVPNIYSK